MVEEGEAFCVLGLKRKYMKKHTGNLEEFESWSQVVSGHWATSVYFIQVRSIKDGLLCCTVVLELSLAALHKCDAQQVCGIDYVPRLGLGKTSTLFQATSQLSERVHSISCSTLVTIIKVTTSGCWHDWKLFIAFLSVLKSICKITM